MKNVLVIGVFNVLHPGHIRFLRFASECGDHLTVAVHTDHSSSQSIHVPEDLRLEGVSSISCVDDAFLTNETVEQLIQRLKPDVLVKGREFEGRDNIEENLLKQYGGELLFDSGEISFSSYEVLRQEFAASDKITFQFPVDYMKRHRITYQELCRQLNLVANLRIAVIGDLILDEYIICDPLGMSQEDPTVVVTPIDKQLFVGGAGIVAAHAAGLGAHVDFISICGKDEMHEQALEMLTDMSVRVHFVIDKHRPTTLKQRYRCKNKTLLRVSHLHQTDISHKLQKKILKAMNEVADDIDLLVFSDFNYGCLPDKLVNMISDIAIQKNIYVVADSQSSSQIGDISRYKNMKLLTPTEHEARVAVHDNSSGLVVLAEKLRQQTNALNILLKLGEEGVLIHAGKDEEIGFATDRIPALNSTPKDVAGAGDSMLIVTAMILCVGGTIWQSALLGSLASAIQVGRLGNTPLTLDEVKRAINP